MRCRFVAEMGRKWGGNALTYLPSLFPVFIGAWVKFLNLARKVGVPFVGMTGLSP